MVGLSYWDVDELVEFVTAFAVEAGGGVHWGMVR